MATLRFIVKDNQKRTDGKFPVSIRLTHDRKSVYISTGLYASKAQLSKSFEIKDNMLLGMLSARIDGYDKIITRLGLEVQNYTARELADYVVEKSKPNQGLDLDFLEAARKLADDIEAKGRKGSARNYRSVINALADLYPNRTITIRSLTVKLLEDFVAYLRSERVVTRPNQTGRTTSTVNEPLSDVSVNNYLRDMRTMYNVIVESLDEESMNEALIRHNPFRKFKIQQRAVTSSERTITVDELRRMMATEMPGDGRAALARDVYVLSFMLLGMNSVDLWELPVTGYGDGRITYNRMKTKGRRSDGALLSIKVEPEVAALIDKYRASQGVKLFTFAERYATAESFNKAINLGLREVADHLGIDSKLTFYTARHTWATVARNECRVSKDDIHLCLNHSDSRMLITDRYIKRSWDFVDEANRKVLDFVFHK